MIRRRQPISGVETGRICRAKATEREIAVIVELISRDVMRVDARKRLQDASIEIRSTSGIFGRGGPSGFRATTASDALCTRERASERTSPSSRPQRRLNQIE